MSSESDVSVLTRSIEEPDCFAALFDRHFAEVYRYLRRRLGDELAAELAAETFLQAFRSRRRFTGRDASVLAWLFGIAANLVRMNHRTEERRLRAYARAAAGTSAYEPAIAVEDRLDAEALGPALARALAGLSPALREVLVLHAWAELSHDEIAEALGCSGAAVPTVLPLGSRLHPSGPTSVIASSVRLAAVVPDPEGSGPAWGLKIYRVKGDETCFQVGREQSGRIGAVGAYGSFGDDGRFHPFTSSNVGFGTCVPNDADQHAFDNVAYANAPASASGEPCQTFAHGFPPHMPARVRARLTAQSHAPDCQPRNQRLVAFGLLGPDATSVTYHTAHGTATTPTHGPDGAYLIVEPVSAAICGTQCDYSGGGRGDAMSLPIGLIATITYRDAPTCHGPPLTNDGRTLLRFDHCRDVGYVAPRHPKVTEANVASPVHVQPMPARYYCVQTGIFRPNVLRIPCDGRVPKGYFRLTGGGPQLMVYVSWIARQPVTNVNDSTYSVQVTDPRRCGGGGQGIGGTQSLIRTGTRVTRDLEVSSRCAGTYRGTVIYEPSLGPTGQGGVGLPELSAPGTYLVGRFSIVVR
jgi:RNA polymerase sigma factor (sigma-70 family)